MPKHVWCHTLNWIGTHPCTTLEYNLFAFNLDVQQSTFFGPNVVLLSTEYTSLAYMYTDHFHEAYLGSLCLAWDPSSCSKRNCLRICFALALLSRRDFNRTYKKLFAVAASGWPCPGRRRTYSISWNWFHNLAMTLFATPTASATLLCVFLDFSFSITRQTVNSGRLHCYDIFSHLF